MAFIRCDLQSKALGTDHWGLGVSVNVILPEADRGDEVVKNLDSEGKFKTLYLLHGLSDDHTTWMRKTSIERYAKQYQIAVIMPAVHRSYYTDMPNGYRYWQFISEELPEKMERFFNISHRRSCRFAAGNSMGGYGAFKLALLKPEKYAAAAALSGALDIDTSMKADVLKMKSEMEFLFGGSVENIKNSRHDLLRLCREYHGDEPVKLYAWCGRQDFHYRDNLAFKAAADENGVPLTFRESDGDHDWSWWDVEIQAVLKWFDAECGLTRPGLS